MVMVVVGDVCTKYIMLHSSYVARTFGCNNDIHFEISYATFRFRTVISLYVYIHWAEFTNYTEWWFSDQLFCVSPIHNSQTQTDTPACMQVPCTTLSVVNRIF